MGTGLASFAGGFEGNPNRAGSGGGKGRWPLWVALMWVAMFAASCAGGEDLGTDLAEHKQGKNKCKHHPDLGKPCDGPDADTCPLGSLQCDESGDLVCVSEGCSSEGACNDDPDGSTCGDTERTNHIGGPGGSVCRQIGGDQATCEISFHTSQDGRASACVWDESEGSCRGCGPSPNRDPNGCSNTCRPLAFSLECKLDPERFVDAGGPHTNSCQHIRGVQECERASHVTKSGDRASCFWNGSDCQGCGPQRAREGVCDNTCDEADTLADGPACDDDARTRFLGGPQAGACQNISDQETCEESYHTTGEGVTASCFWDGGSCRGCGVNGSLGQCTDTCGQDDQGNSCEGDSARTAYVGRQGTNACRRFGLDQATCESAFHTDQSGFLSRCFWSENEQTCRGCGLSRNRDREGCQDTCEDPGCESDPDRTRNAGGPGQNACRVIGSDQASCEASFHRDQTGSESRCFWSENEQTCRGCGLSPNRDREGCQDTCEDAGCESDSDRTRNVGGPGGGVCRNYGGDQASCEATFHRDQTGALASCFWSESEQSCRGCGLSPNRDREGCDDTCEESGCDEDSDRTRNMGGPGQNACRRLGGDQAACELAFHTDHRGVVSSCVWDENEQSCRGCGITGVVEGRCADTCEDEDGTSATCGGNDDGHHSNDDDDDDGGHDDDDDGHHNDDDDGHHDDDDGDHDDDERTLFVGGPGRNVCQRVQDEATCNTSFHQTQHGTTASCFWDGSSCRGCGPANLAQCTDACGAEYNHPACPGDASRTWVGGPGNSVCRRAPDEATCNESFHQTQFGTSAACVWDSDQGTCRGCGRASGNQQGFGACEDVCEDPYKRSCEGDPSRAFVGGSGTNGSACRQINNQEACESSYHFGRQDHHLITPSPIFSCVWDENEGCRGCGERRNREGVGACANECKVGECSDNSSEIACHEDSCNFTWSNVCAPGCHEAPDNDQDGVPDAEDKCLGTPAGELVNAKGCTINQLCPCDAKWKNHGKYVKCVQKKTKKFKEQGLLTKKQKETIDKAADKSKCGDKKKNNNDDDDHGGDYDDDSWWDHDDD